MAKRRKNLLVQSSYSGDLLVPEELVAKYMDLVRQCEFITPIRSYNDDFPCPAQYVEARVPNLSYTEDGTIFSPEEYTEWQLQKDAFEEQVEKRQQLEIDEADVNEEDA